ncbi:unnamed protein product [Mytilus coruscus]|uniref:Uncharacterized protein n=1 Tax=Mytilus coruscus TaxID=42192 RepID=A0A6J8AHV7_MYTCO|nr:unnamed protein product [Mytilus coruscus]
MKKNSGRKQKKSKKTHTDESYEDLYRRSEAATRNLFNEFKKDAKSISELNFWEDIENMRGEYHYPEEEGVPCKDTDEVKEDRTSNDQDDIGNQPFDETSDNQDDIGNQPFDETSDDQADIGNQPFDETSNDQDDIGNQPFDEMKQDDIGNQPFDETIDQDDIGNQPFDETSDDQDDIGNQPFDETSDDQDDIGNQPFDETIDDQDDIGNQPFDESSNDQHETGNEPEENRNESANNSQIQNNEAVIETKKQDFTQNADVPIRSSDSPIWIASETLIYLPEVKPDETSVIRYIFTTHGLHMAKKPTFRDFFKSLFSCIRKPKKVEAL